MSILRIDTAELMQSSTSVITLNEQLHQRLGEISKTLDEIAAAWDSPSGRAFAEQIQNVKPDFENSTKCINSFALFLGAVSESYEQVEMRNHQEADEI